MESGDVFEVKEGSSGDLFYVVFKGEVIVKDDSEVATVKGWRQGEGVDSEGETVNGFSDGFGTDDDHVCFFAVELKEIGVHPGFNVSEAVGDSGVGGRGDGFSGDVELNIIGIAVKVETMVANDIAKGKQV